MLSERSYSFRLYLSLCNLRNLRMTIGTQS